MSSMGTVSELSEALSSITLDDVLSRHRRERKDMQAKIQALKKNAPKNDKKKRKEAMEEVARMESDLEKRQAAEIAEIEETKLPQHKEDKFQRESPSEQQQKPKETLSHDEDEENTSSTTQRVSKAQKRRDKKAREARQREEDIRAAADDAKFSPKAIETCNIQAKLLERQLTLYNIPSDGDCLYNAVRHQLSQTGLTAYSVQELRNETANYVSANKEALICYMTNPKTGDLLTDAEFKQYCEALRTTPAWGGQIELKALSSILKVPIEVLQAEGPPTVQGSGEFVGPNLLITYHRHMYSLGEHYNSTVPIELVGTSKNNDND